MLANDTIQIANIGFGGMGQADTRAAASIPGVKVVAVSDLYDGRLEHAKEVYGASTFTTRDYREVLARPDIDAVIIATPDHWHAKITVDALAAGKHVYCEKPMVHAINEGHTVIAAQNKTNKTFQVGSQYASSLAFKKAKELLAQGAIGKLNLVETMLDRNTAIGAWQYSIPTDASPQTVDWDRFLANTPKRPFDATRFFRWRNYQDYGTGVAGDLFVHLLTGLHFATGSIGPVRVNSMGGLRFWKDGRDVPDVMLALMDYPQTAAHSEFTMTLRVNFAAGGPAENFAVKFVGSEGIIAAGMNSVSLSRHPREAEPGYTIDAFPKATQQAIISDYLKKYPQQRPTADAMRPDRDEVFRVPREYDAHVEHHRAFYDAVRAGRPSIEDAVFGLRAAGPALLANTSYFERRICKWDPQAMQAS